MKRYTWFSVVFVALTLTGLASAHEQTLIWFGNLELNKGALKSANGDLPRRGESALLRVFKQELAQRVYDGSGAYMGGYGAYGKDVSLFVRFNDQPAWKEIPLKGAVFYNRGPRFEWDEYQDVVLQIPKDASRIETWLRFSRVVPSDCYLAYDMMECSGFYAYRDAYLSNYGRNFRISVE